jgi:hypothetical protein
MSSPSLVSLLPAVLQDIIPHISLFSTYLSQFDPRFEFSHPLFSSSLHLSLLSRVRYCSPPDVTLSPLIPSSLSPLFSSLLALLDDSTVGQRVWPSSALLAEFFHLLVIHDSQYFSDSRLLELGCGVGMLALAIAAQINSLSSNDLSPPQIVFSDLSPALLLSLVNFHLNQEIVQSLQIQAVEVNWFAEQTNLVSNENSPFPGGFSFIVCSDCAFDHSLVSPLVRTIKTLVKRSDDPGIVLIAHEERLNIKNLNDKMFQQTIAERIRSLLTSEEQGDSLNEYHHPAIDKFVHSHSSDQTLELLVFVAGSLKHQKIVKLNQILDKVLTIKQSHC